MAAKRVKTKQGAAPKASAAAKVARATTPKPAKRNAPKAAPAKALPSKASATKAPAGKPSATKAPASRSGGLVYASALREMLAKRLGRL
jgi:hypothetical protein